MPSLEQRERKKKKYAPSYMALATAVAPTPTNAPIRAKEDNACAASCAGDAIF